MKKCFSLDLRGSQMKENVKITYLYRDGANWKNWGEVIFSNDEGLSVSEIECRIRREIVEQEVFVAHQIRIPELFPPPQDLSIHDHCYHEFDVAEITLEPADDFWQRDISGFLSDLQNANRVGWDVFDIYCKCRPQAS